MQLPIFPRRFFALYLLCIALVSFAGCESNPLTLSQDSLTNAEKIIVTYDDGTPCDDSGESCTSGFCVDGVCCESACDGLCVACSRELNDSESGKCLPVQDNIAPADSKTDDCTSDSSNVCGHTGYCSGTFAPGSTSQSNCALATSSVICEEARCFNNDAFKQRNCTGLGSCGGQEFLEQCGLYACEMNDSNPQCRTNCTSDDHCDEGTNAWCYLGLDTNPNYGRCVVGLRDGEVAQTGSQCGSGFAADGVCCSSGCDETCHACKSAYNGAVSGTCSPVTAGTTWIADCPLAAPSSCGNNGQCNGQGACSLYDANTVCSAAECDGSTLNQPSTCNGQGSCEDPIAQECEPYYCNPGTNPDSCFTDCQNDQHCAANNYCYFPVSGQNFCTDLLDDGESCTTGSQCASDSCVDGVCCRSSACPGECQSCNQALTGGAAGECNNIRDGTDPENECAASSCASDTHEIPKATCQSGSCNSPSPALCAPYSCTNSSCNTSCPWNSFAQEHPNCADATPYCTWGVCSDNTPPTAYEATHQIPQNSTSFTFNLTASDPQDDALTFVIESGLGNLTLNDPATGSVTYTINQCRGDNGFWFHVLDEHGLWSSWAWITLSVTNIAPTISSIPNQNVPWATLASASYTYGDACDPVNDLTVSSYIVNGTGSTSVDPYNGTGYVIWKPEIPGFTLDEACRGSSPYFYEQSATVAVEVRDVDQWETATTFQVQMSGATQCEDYCSEDFLIGFLGGCWTEDIRPSPCYYCKDLYSQRCAAESCDRFCIGFWEWPCYDYNCRCTQYETYLSGNSCDSTTSAEGILIDWALFWADLGCVGFNWIYEQLGANLPNPFCLPDRCWWQ